MYVNAFTGVIHEACQKHVDRDQAMSETRSGGYPGIPYTRFLDPEGVVCAPLPAFAKQAETLLVLYRDMVLTRVFDAKAIALQRTGRLGTYASSLGQEAVGAGIGRAMRPEDVFLPSFREPAAMFIRGVRMSELLLYWGGDERGSDFAGPREDFPICVPVGTHAPHAAGVALAMRLRGEKRAALCAMGDGATSKGDVYEAMNLAGVWRLPVVFVVNNNQSRCRGPSRRRPRPWRKRRSPPASRASRWTATTSSRFAIRSGARWKRRASTGSPR
jgi:2-oxoisovalerate dehydrogenase E1 component alpha subunit